MTTVMFKGNAVSIKGDLPNLGSIAPEFKLVKGDLSEVLLSGLKGRKKILNIFPSIDTQVCATSVQKFNEAVNELPDVMVLNISCDLPFAQKRFCDQNHITTTPVSAFRSSFGTDYGVELAEGPLKGLFARTIIALDEDNRVIYSELVPEITEEPSYDKALEAVK